MKKTTIILSLGLANLFSNEFSYDFNQDHLLPFYVKNLSLSKEEKALPAWYVNGGMIRNRNYDSNSILLNDKSFLNEDFKVQFQINYLHNDIQASKAGFIFAYENKNKYYILEIEKKKKFVKSIKIKEIRDNKVKTLANIDYVFNSYKNDFILENKNGSLSLFINSKKKLQLNNIKINLFKYGFYLNKSSKNIAFDNLKLKLEDIALVSNKKNLINNSSSSLKEKQKPKLKVIEEIKSANKKIEEKKDRFYLAYDLGFAKLSSSKDSSIKLNKSLDDSSLAHNLEIGMFINKNISTSLNYNKISLDNASMDNIYLASNYRFNKTLNPFLGLRAGLSKLKWDKSSFKNFQGGDLSSQNAFLGLQAGLEYKIRKNISILTKYSFDFIKHETKVNTSEIEYKNLNNLSIGLRYYFK